MLCCDYLDVVAHPSPTRGDEDTQGIPHIAPIHGTGVLEQALKPERIVWVSALPKTRSAKVLRRAIRAVVTGDEPGDLSGLEDPATLDAIAASA